MGPVSQSSIFQAPPADAWKSMDSLLKVLEMSQADYNKWVSSKLVKKHARKLLDDIIEFKEYGTKPLNHKVEDIMNTIRKYDWDTNKRKGSGWGDLDGWWDYFEYDYRELVDWDTEDDDKYARFTAQIARNIQRNHGEPGTPLSDDKYYDPKAQEYIFQVVWQFWLRLRHNVVNQPKDVMTLEKELLGYKAAKPKKPAKPKKSTQSSKKRVKPDSDSEDDAGKAPAPKKAKTAKLAKPTKKAKEESDSDDESSEAPAPKKTRRPVASKKGGKSDDGVKAEESVKGVKAEDSAEDVKAEEPVEGVKAEASDDGGDAGGSKSKTSKHVKA